MVPQLSQTITDGNAAPRQASLLSKHMTSVHRGEAPVILFDGLCNLCNRSVAWVIKRDRRRKFRFASLQSDAARRVIEEAAAPCTIDDLPDSVVFRDVDGASTWCDVIQSAPVETCEDIARLALDDALVWIDESWGGALEGLRWGDAHEATHDHPVLGEIPVLRWLVNIRQSTSGGDNTLLRGMTSGTGENPFLNVHGPGYRGVYDFADPDSSVFIISTGQSGHPLSRHYDDLGELWRRGEYIPMTLDADLARAGAVGVTRLLPED